MKIKQRIIFYILILGIVTFYLYGKKPDGDTIKQKLKEDAVVVDVRTNGEFNSGHIKDAIHIPLKDISSKIDFLKELKKPIIVYCASGGRSKKAMNILKEKGIDAIDGGGKSNLEKYLK